MPRITHLIPTATVTFAACLSPIALASFCQPQGNEPPPKPVTILAFEHSGIGSLLVHPKDQKLKEAIELIPSRIKELPNDFPEMREFPMPAVDLIITALAQPGRLALTWDPDGQPKGAFGFGLIAAHSLKDQNTAMNMHGRIAGLLKMAGAPDDAKPSAEFKGMSELPAPFGGVIRYGPQETKDGWQYQLHVGAARPFDEAFAPLRAARLGPKDFNTIFAGRLDFAALSQVVTNFTPLIEGAGPEAEVALTEAQKLGLLGEDAVKITIRSGHTADAHVGYAAIEGLKKHAKEMGVSTTPLTNAHFAMIPSDATVAMISSYNIRPGLEALREQIKTDPDATEQLEQFEGATGVNLFDDVLLCLGGTSGVYMSDSTGGAAGLASLVFFTSLHDRAKFEQAHAKLVGFANSMLTSHHEIKGRIRVRSWDPDGANGPHLHSIIFPGLPVPLEVTYALSGDWIIAGLTPQSTLAAVRQATGKGDQGLRVNKSFLAAMPEGAKSATSFMFIDTPNLMRYGYQYISLMGSAVANLVRSATNDGREPGLVVPTYADLRKDAKPLLSVTYWNGDDQITESRGDPSMLVNLSGVAGAMSPFIPILSAAMAASAQR